MQTRVKLIKSLIPEELPVGICGEVLDPPLVTHGMNLIQWDNGMVIPMYRSEIEDYGKKYYIKEDLKKEMVKAR